MTMPRALPSIHHEVEHFGVRVHGHGAGGDLPLERLVGTEQQLLARLAAGVKRALDLNSAERAGREQAAVFAGERHPLGDALVDDVDADLRQPVGVALAGAEVAPLDRVVKEAENAVAVVAVVLGGVDPALGGDRVGPARAVVIRKAMHLVALLAERGGRGRPGQARADDQDGVLPPVGGAHQLHVEAALVPFLFNRSRRDLAIEHLYTPSAYPAGQHGDRHRDKAGEHQDRHHSRQHPEGR